MAEQQGSEPILPEWGPGKTARGRARLPSSRRRDRPTLSCITCRRMKLRCDRQKPCATCVHRGIEISCEYAQDVAPSSDRAATQSRGLTVQARIQQLESLVIDLMHKTNKSGSSEPLAHENAAFGTPNTLSSVEETPSGSERGSVQMTKMGSRYVHGAHWAAILDEISQLRDQLDHEDEIDTQTPPDLIDQAQRSTQPHLIYGCASLPTREQILASIPPRPEADRLVSAFFNYFEMSPSIIHSYQFLQEYDEFWADSSTTSFIWLALLFVIMSLAIQLRLVREVGDPSTTMSVASGGQLDMFHEFRQKAVQCLILGDYAKGGNLVLETLLLYLALELFLHKDAEVSIWIILGTIVQLALHMGYHRDPRHFKNMSVLDSEMRKRVWATVVDLDMATSAQMGLPRLIKPWQTDVTEPANLLDSDLNATTVDLPAARPETELTPMLVRIVKSRLMNSVGLIWDFAVDTRLYTYEQVEELDRQLRGAHEAIPECLKWRSIAQCVTDPANLIVQKVFLDIVIQRGRIVLHRRHQQTSPVQAHRNASEKACLDAALKVLKFQELLDEETQPFCQLHQESWKISSLVTNDFLLAMSVCCVYAQRAGNINAERKQQVLIALKKSYEVWLRSINFSKEAQKAVKALSAVLSKEGMALQTPALFEQNSGSPFTNLTSFCHSLDLHFPAFDTSLDGTSGIGDTFGAFTVLRMIPWAGVANRPEDSKRWDKSLLRLNRNLSEDDSPSV